MTKLANRAIVYAEYRGDVPVTDPATRAYVNSDLVYHAIRGRSGWQHRVDAKAPMVMDRNFKPGFRIDFCISKIWRMRGYVPRRGSRRLTAAVMEMMQALRADGLGTADHSALACYYEKSAKKRKSLAIKKWARDGAPSFLPCAAPSG